LVNKGLRHTKQERREMNRTYVDRSICVNLSKMGNEFRAAEINDKLIDY